MSSPARPVKRSLIAQISAVQTEIENRDEVYGRLVASGKMRRAEADYKTDDMRAVLATLHWVKAHEDGFRALVKAKREAL